MEQTSRHKTLILSCLLSSSPQAMPLAAGILKAYIETNLSAVQVVCRHFFADHPPDYQEIQTLIRDQQPNSVGFSLYLWNRNFFFDLAQRLRKDFPELILYAGGPEVTARGEKFRSNSPFHHLIPGEGERPLLSLVSQLSQEDLPAPVTEESHLWPREALITLDESPSPFLTGCLLPEEWPGVLWELSRGCPFKCSFCAESRGEEGVRSFDLSRIERELILFEETGVDQLFVLDPTFNMNKERALTLIDLFRTKGPSLHYTLEIRGELLDQELVEALAEIRCSLQVGLQSSDPQVLTRVNRTFHEKKFRENMEALNHNGITFGLDLIYGLPGDSYTGFLKSLNFALGCIPNHLDIFRLSLFPGTDLHDRAEKEGLIFTDTPPYQIISTPDFPAEDLDRCDRLAFHTHRIYNQGAAAPWLLPFCDALGREPSAVLEDFALYSQENPPAEKETEQELCDALIGFIHKETRRRKKKYLKPLMEDLCRYHLLYSRVLQAPPPEPGEQPGNQERLIPAQSLGWADFHYSPVYYAENGMFDLIPFYQETEQEPETAILYQHQGMVETLCVSPLHRSLLEQLDKKALSKRELINSLSYGNGKLTPEDMEDFLSFFCERGLILPIS